MKIIKDDISGQSAKKNSILVLKDHIKVTRAGLLAIGRIAAASLHWESGFFKAPPVVEIPGGKGVTIIERRKMINLSPNVFLNQLRRFLNTEVHIKADQDENPVLYTLTEIGKDFILVHYGESLRIIPANKIIFVQIGDYPKKEF